MAMIIGYNVRSLRMLQDDAGTWFYEYEGKPYTGYAFALFPKNDKLSYEYNLINGYQDGLQKQWHETGQLLTEQYFSNNIPHGKCLEWHENGVLRFEGEYNMGKRIWSKTYNEIGELIKKYPQLS